MFKSIWGTPSDQFVRTKKMLSEVASHIVDKWYAELDKVKPHWWGRQAASNGSINQVKTPFGIKIFYASKSEFDYMDIVENGRGTHDIKKDFARSPRRRKKDKGGWYMIIPFTTNKEPDEDGKKKSSIVNPTNNPINSIMTKVSEYKDSQGEIRGKYTYTQDKTTTRQGNVVKTPQKTKRGVTYSYMKFVVCSDTSSGWMYPAIPAHKIAEKLEKEGKQLLSSGAFRKGVENDVETYIKAGLRNLGKI